jgi:hypothetical protein
MQVGGITSTRSDSSGCGIRVAVPAASAPAIANAKPNLGIRDGNDGDDRASEPVMRPITLRSRARRPAGRVVLK